jgi:tryptophanyl-tRNA synthetase
MPPARWRCCSSGGREGSGCSCSCDLAAATVVAVPGAGQSCVLTATPKVPGLDGRKMSKSYGNTIGLREDPDSVAKKLRTMQTDPARVRRTDVGDPEKCPVFDLHRIYSTASTQAEVAQGCRTAGFGCIDCKQPLIEAVVTEIRGIRSRSAEFAANPARLRSIIDNGSERARAVANETMNEVRSAMGLGFK